MGLVAPQHVGSSQTRARTCVPCIGRRILNHCATREVWNYFVEAWTDIDPNIAKKTLCLTLLSNSYFRYMWSIPMRKLSLSTTWVLLLKMNIWLNTIKMDPELYKNLSMKKNKTILKIWGLTSQNLIDLSGHPGLWFKQYVHHSDGKKKRYRGWCVLGWRSVQVQRERRAEASHSSLKVRRIIWRMRIPTYCSRFMRWPYDPEFLRQLQGEK